MPLLACLRQCGLPFLSRPGKLILRSLHPVAILVGHLVALALVGLADLQHSGLMAAFLGPALPPALLSRDGPLGPVCGAVEHYEWGHWDRLSEAAAALNLDEAAMPVLFAAAVQWADNALRSM